MQRRRALSLAAMTTLMLGSAVVATCAVAGVPILGFGADAATNVAAIAPLTTTTTAKPRVVVRVQDVFDRVVVDTAPPVVSSPSPAPSAPAPTIAAPTPATTAAPPAAPTTTPPTTTQAREPSDDDVTQPSTSPPPGCAQPQLEDNGTWNCDH